ncbi:MAG: ribonuclease HIII [Lentisphaerae bacterium]|nr:ribonuclease HIII [Lentisphaerota bacterium]MBR2873754.1 ribonuclease HIII [Lentisphaeria bacterium]
MPKTSYTVELNSEQIEHLQTLLEERGWELSVAPYAVFRAKKEKTNVTAYESGKTVVQGKGTDEFIEFILEPEILHDIVVFPDESENTPEIITPHGGIDESGKGDFFGPLVIAGVSVTAETGEKLRALGVCDSKKITSDKKIAQLAVEIKKCVGEENIAVVYFKMETYNRLYTQFGNLNRLLAWGHATVIEKLLEKNPSVPRMLSDQFADPSLIQRALMERGRQIIMEQRTKAESDIAVAAASILARDRFVQCIAALEEQTGCTLPKGAGANVKAVAAEIVRNSGADGLRRCCKNHFKTFEEVLNGC